MSRVRFYGAMRPPTKLPSLIRTRTPWWHRLWQLFKPS